MAKELYLTKNSKEKYHFIWAITPMILGILGFILLMIFG